MVGLNASRFRKLAGKDLVHVGRQAIHRGQFPVYFRAPTCQTNIPTTVTVGSVRRFCRTGNLLTRIFDVPPDLPAQIREWGLTPSVAAGCRTGRDRV